MQRQSTRTLFPGHDWRVAEERDERRTSLERKLSCGAGSKNIAEMSKGGVRPGVRMSGPTLTPDDFWAQSISSGPEYGNAQLAPRRPPPCLSEFLRISFGTRHDQKLRHENSIFLQPAGSRSRGGSETIHHRAVDPPASSHAAEDDEGAAEDRVETLIATSPLSCEIRGAGLVVANRAVRRSPGRCLGRPTRDAHARAWHGGRAKWTPVTSVSRQARVSFRMLSRV